MLLKRARICNYHNFGEVSIVFEPFSALVGPNNIGKSSILHALDYIFTPSHPRNVVISKTDFSDASKPIIVEAVLGGLNSADQAAFYHDDGLINTIDNTITIRFESSWSSADQDVLSECYFVRGDLPESQQRMVDFSTRYKQYLPYYIISSERSAVQEMGISKNRDLGRVLRVYSSDYLKPLPTLLAELKTAFQIIQKDKNNWPGFPIDLFNKADTISLDVFTAIPPDFILQLSGKDLVIIDKTLDALDLKWKGIGDDLLPFTERERQTAYREYLAQIVEKMPILIRRAKTQLSLYELRNGMLEERKFEEMNLGFKQIFDTMLPGQTVGINLFSIQDDDLISQMSVDLDDQSILTTGSGFQSMFVIGLKLVRMLAQLRTSSGSHNIRNFVVGIEEPENHLHPHMQRHLVNFVRKLQDVWMKEGYQLQIVITSHSPSVICRFEPWELILLQRENNKVSAYKWENNQIEAMVKELEAEPKKRGKKTTQLQLFVDFFMEHFSDVFFSQCVIIVEGDTEEGAIPVWAKKISPPLDFDNLGICIINSSGDNMQYAMKVLGTFKIPHVVLYDRGDNHTVDNISKGRLFPSKNNEFEDDLFETAQLKSLIKAVINSNSDESNQYRFGALKGMIDECAKIADLEGLVSLIENDSLKPDSVQLLWKEVKNWIKKSKGLFQGKMIAQETSEEEIPKYICEMFDDIRKSIIQRVA
ncbi:MAG: AAA family ATPase [Anaerolineales bacterium]